jgi:hypothetical protein
MMNTLKKEKKEPKSDKTKKPKENSHGISHECQNDFKMK